jgi:tol-pal system protein YbgF
LGLLILTAPAYGAELEERVQRLEKLMDSQGLVDMFLQMQSLQEEVRQLRGQVEQQTYAIENLKQRQRDLYLDIDRRMRKLEGGGSVSPSTSSPSVSSTPGAPATTASAAPSSSADEDAAYRSAFNLLKEGRYQDAIKRFSAFLKKYPNSGYADNAQYWLGEANYVTRKYEQAIKEFELVVTTYPQSDKRADALLKVGYCQYELKAYDKAKEALTRVVQEFPKTTAARLADNRLQRMKLEGQGGTPPAR